MLFEELQFEIPHFVKAAANLWKWNKTVIFKETSFWPYVRTGCFSDVDVQKQKKSSKSL